MRRQTLLISILAIFLLFDLSTFVLAIDTGSIEGSIKDKQTGTPLPGANILLVGTSLGAASTPNGKYIITKVPVGEYKLRATYIGYKTVEVPVKVSINARTVQDFKLEYVAIGLGEVVVTAQAEGQMNAINQQLSSSSIVNVVSSARIQELPDANAAESMARLPGVSITRVGGEGNQIVIRGLEPKYNVILIDGVRMASSNPRDRSADLSTISSNMLDGIEIMKTVTADQDADVLGGTVNFKMREAKGGKEGLGIQLLAQNGYTGLSNAYDKFDNYKLVPSIEGRFFKEKLGLFMQANLERRNLSSNEFGASYANKAADQIYYVTQSINLNNILRDRKRINGTVMLDYRLPQGKIGFMNFVSSGITAVQNRNESINVNGNTHTYALGFTKSTLNMTSNILSIEKQLPFVHADFKVSHNYSETKNPNDWSVAFYQVPAGISQYANKGNLNPKSVAQAVFTDSSKTKLNTVSATNSFAQERAWMTSLDLDLPLNLSENITSIIKFGGKYRTQKRSYNAEVYGTNATFISPSAQGASRMVIEHFQVPTKDPLAIPLSFFLDENYDYGEFLEGDYEMHHPMKFDMIRDLVDFCQDNVEAFRKAGSAEAFARNNYLSTTNNYTGKEVITAGYVMATVNLGSKLTIIPGIRYQNIKTTYSGTRGQQTPLSYFKYDHSADTTVTVNHPYWLPNVNVRYKPVSWFDVRLAYSNTISYPDFNTIIPRIDATTGAALAWNNYNLKPSHSKNYDVYFSFSGNDIGLFTVGGFLKQINDLIYPWNFSKAGLEATPYYLTNKKPAAHLNYNISTFINNPFVIDNWGLEFDWQTHFWYLPGPLKGLVLNANYTHIFSKAEYPFVYAGATSATDIDTSFTDRLLRQPNHIINLSVGYDYKGFSIRVSMLYQDDVFSGVSQWEQLRSSTAAYQRWDISFKQNLPWFGLQLFGDVNNLNNERDLNVLQMYPDIPRASETYGLSADLGFRWQF